MEYALTCFLFRRFVPFISLKAFIFVSHSIKMYDKFRIVLRIETTVTDVSFFKHYRQVHHRDGTTTTQWAPMKKTIYSLPALQENLLAANHRYLKFIADVQTSEVGVKKLHQLTETVEENQHRYKGFNLLSEEDASLFRLLLRGEFFIQGFMTLSTENLPTPMAENLPTWKKGENKITPIGIENRKNKDSHSLSISIY